MTSVDDSKRAHWEDAQQRHGAFRAPPTPPLKSGGGSGTSGGMSDGETTAWRATVAQNLRFLNWAGGLLLATIGGGFLFLLLRMDGGFSGVQSRFDIVDQRLSRVEQTAAAHTVEFRALNEKIDRIDRNVSVIAGTRMAIRREDGAAAAAVDDSEPQ